ncbi:unnamed protein product [Linum tenue]|uniref:Hydroxyproline-rich glycoprotein family protein n=1 Tax=Linum tenue TaxID=586396 RepID=A0AAV0J1G9_9ROSI|nr:unnamed protein product [Linum tenue]
MESKEGIETSRRRHIREPPSVPFLWEDRPGIAKKGWKPEVAPHVVTPLPSLPPVKLIASVPFKWEERPGTPLSRFSQPSSLDDEGKLASQVKVLPLPPALMYSEADTKNVDDDDDDDWYQRSPSSLFGNCLMSSAAVSAAVPVIDSAFSMDEQWERPASPAYESDSSTSSYATGRSSLVGSSFLECLFPLYKAASGSREEETDLKNGSSTPPLELTGRDIVGQGSSDGALVVRKPPTLGELIMMSRRRSVQRKANQMRLQNPSMELMKGQPFKCCVFGTGIKMIDRLQKKMHHTRLALL